MTDDEIREQLDNFTYEDGDLGWNDQIRAVRSILQVARATLADHSKLQVWSGSMPESNGKTNFTAILHRGDLIKGFTIDRSEYPDRVRYEADRVRWLIGEIDKEPRLLDYDADKHSGYATPADHSGEATEKVDAGSVPVAYTTPADLEMMQKHNTGVIYKEPLNADIPLYAAPQPPQNAADHIEAQSVPVAEMPLTSGAGPQKLAWFKHPDSFAPGTKLYAQSPQPDAQSVRDAVPEAHRILDELIDIYDDGNKNAPEDRCYVEGAWRETIDEAREYLKSAPPQKPVSDEVKP